MASHLLKKTELIPLRKPEGALRISMQFATSENVSFRYRSFL